MNLRNGIFLGILFSAILFGFSYNQDGYAEDICLNGGVFTGEFCDCSGTGFTGEFCEVPIDSDGDGINDNFDNCDTISNVDQADSNGDEIGDVCDTVWDADLDGFPNTTDDCPMLYDPSQSNLCDGLFVDQSFVDPNIRSIVGLILNDNRQTFTPQVNELVALDLILLNFEPTLHQIPELRIAIIEGDPNNPGQVLAVTDYAQVDVPPSLSGVPIHFGIESISLIPGQTYFIHPSIISSEPNPLTAWALGAGYPGGESFGSSGVGTYFDFGFTTYYTNPVQVSDSDGDGIIDDIDNCDFVKNASQEDTDDNGIGDACESQISCAAETTLNESTNECEADVTQGDLDLLQSIIDGLNATIVDLNAQIQNLLDNEVTCGEGTILVGNQCLVDGTVEPEKVTLCHKDKKTMTISSEDVDDHLAHGDELGVCEE